MKTIGALCFLGIAAIVLTIGNAQGPSFGIVTISESPKILMDQSERYVWLHFIIGENHVEPKVSINLNESNFNVLFIRINDLQKAFKLPAPIKWPVHWVYYYENSQLTLVLERFEQVTFDKQYWRNLDEHFQKSWNEKLLYDQQTSGYEYKIQFYPCEKLVDDHLLMCYHNFEFLAVDGSHKYANHPFGTYYTINVTGTDRKIYQHIFFPIPRELLDASVNNRETYLKARKELVGTDEKQKLYVENGILGEESSGWNGQGSFKFERQPVMLSNNKRYVSLTDAILNLPVGHKILFFGITNGVTTYFETIIYLCLNTDRTIRLFYISNAEKYSIFKNELNKVVSICDGRLEVHRIYPGKKGISVQEERKRYHDGFIHLGGISEITSNLIQYKGTYKPPKDAIFISVETENVRVFNEFLINSYGYNEDNIYYFVKDPRPLQLKEINIMP